LDYRSGGHLHIGKVTLFKSEALSNPFLMLWQTGEGYLEFPGAVMSTYIVAFFSYRDLPTQKQKGIVSLGARG
jgi:hypothetical protein